MRLKRAFLMILVIASCGPNQHPGGGTIEGAPEIDGFESTTQYTGRPGPNGFEHIVYDYLTGNTSVTRTPSLRPTTDANTRYFILDEPKKALINQALDQIRFKEVVLNYLPDTTPATLGDGPYANITFTKGAETKMTYIDTIEPEKLPVGVDVIFDAIQPEKNFFSNDGYHPEIHASPLESQTTRSNKQRETVLTR